MNTLINAAFARSRTTLLVLLLLVTGGWLAYANLPREAAPQVDIPYFFITVTYPGITADDAERLLLQPLERELQTLTGLRQIDGWAGEGFALVQLEFAAATDNRQALADVREKMDLVQSDLPPGANVPQVAEVDFSLFPILTVGLSGAVDERTLNTLARQARDRIESLPGVLEVVIGGEREEILEILIDPLTLESYRIGYDTLLQALERNNLVVAAGSMDTGAGRAAISVPGTIRDQNDILQTTIRATDGTIVTVADIAEVRRSFADPTGFARVNGQGAVSLEIRKTPGANIISTVDAAREELRRLQADWPDTVQLTELQSMADDIAMLLDDLENSVLLATLLVLATLIIALGYRAAGLVAFAIPAAFLSGLLGIALLGFTLNIVVLFALILVVGMLVDGAVVVTELADRHLAMGHERADAFRLAAQRMAWPITASIATTLIVFLPMLFWPGMVGQFLIFLPSTVIVTLLASLAMALIFIPVLGALLGPHHSTDPVLVQQVKAAESGQFDALNPATRRYLGVLALAVDNPGKTTAATAVLTVLLVGLYGLFGRGLEFFPSVDPDFVQIQVHARGNLSVHEADALVRDVEAVVRDEANVRSVYARTIGDTRARLGGNLPEDVIGIVRLDLEDWRRRDPVADILSRLRGEAARIPGVKIQMEEQQRGPPMGKPVVMQVSGQHRVPLAETVEQIRAMMETLGGFEDINDDLPLPRVELQWAVDRSEIGRYGADIAHLGQSLQLLTNGVLLGTYRPDDMEDEIDIRMRFPMESRNLDQLINLRLITAHGLVPVSNFAELVPVPAPGLLRRVDAMPAYTLEAEVARGYLADERVRTLQQAITELDLPEGINLRFRGQAEDQQEAASFLQMAFLLSILFMALVLVTQFNSIKQALLVMSAIVFSTTGVLMGLLLRMEPFSVVMSGVSILAVAGIVVNNNIVLLDTYNRLRRDGLAARDAALRTGAQRMRPVLLTAITTILGLTPMVLAVSVDLVGRDFHTGGPSTQLWVQLATGIVGGLLVATPVTLLFTPAVAAWLDRLKERRQVSPL